MKSKSTRKPHEADRCGAKTRAGGTCKRWPLHGRKRCRLHGGLTPRGPDSANWKTGLHSKHVPANLQGLLEDAARDPHLADTRPDLVRVTALLLHWLKNSGDSLTPDAVRSFLDLTDARLRVLTFQDRLRRQADDTLTVAQFHRLAMVMIDSVRSHAGEDAARLVRRDIDVALAAGVFRRGGDDAE
jgi:hypothetical protein